jgi:hypothetical protein
MHVCDRRSDSNIHVLIHGLFFEHSPSVSFVYHRGLQRVARGPHVARGTLCRGPPAVLKK